MVYVSYQQIQGPLLAIREIQRMYTRLLQRLQLPDYVWLNTRDLLVEMERFVGR